jgi:hypothetical protein
MNAERWGPNDTLPDETNEALRDIAAAIRELVAALAPPRTAAEPVVWNCEICGSPRWKPGGMGREFKECVDCGTIGEEIEGASANDQS